MIGAGVVGLACARAIAQAGLEVAIIERENAYGTGVSARNSEVIHAGLYYPAGSRKAQWCVRGARLLYDHCAQRGIAHRRCGKLLVATREADVEALEKLRAKALANGVNELRWLTRAQALTLEPELQCVAALWSPASGIVDSHGLMTSLLGDAFELATNWIVNAAGLDAQAVAAAMEGFPAAAIPPRHLAKGHYFSLSGRAPFSRLIYPMPTDGGLGVHLTLDLGGQAKFGPDVEWIDEVTTAADLGRDLDYTADARRADAFAAEVRRYWPRLLDGALAPAYSGIRPKLSGPGEPAADFWLQGPADHGCAGVLQLFGIESPGLTASLAIAEAAAALVTGSSAG